MSIDTTTTTRTDTSVQRGVQLVVNEKRDTVQVGNYVTDVSIQPYIANRVVAFYAYNMRPNQRLHAFFDSVLVDDYCTPGIIPAVIRDTSDYHSIEKNGNMGDQLKTDAKGQIAGWFNIPAATFKTGDRVFQLCDADSIANGTDAITTMSAATFTASNLSVTKQGITLTTVNPEISTVPVTNTIVRTTTSQNITINPEIGEVRGSFGEPLAQGLTINTPSGEAGIFATSIDLYFKQKAQIVENGISVYICETENGYPAGAKVIPFSTVHKNFADVVISQNGSVPTKFTFESPVFLNSGTEYAFVVKPDAGDPDYWVYTAELGNTDIRTGKQMFGQPVLGTAFYGATETQWTALQSEYVKFDLNRARFTKQNGDVYFKNTDYEYINVTNLAYDNLEDGILSGDYVFQSTTSSVATVNTSVYGVLNFYDDVKDIFYVSNTTGNFSENKFIQVHRFANSTLVQTPGPNTSTLIAYANTTTLHNVGLDILVPQFASITPAGSSLDFNFTGVDQSYGSDITEIPINPGETGEFYDKTRIVASKTNEINYMGGAKSLNIRARMTTDSDFITPIIDTARNQQLVVANDIDPIVFKYEEFFNSGDSKSKYVSKVITLANGQDAEDLQIILSAYRPIGTDIQVWVKFLNGEDSDPISNKTWCPMINAGVTTYSTPGNITDMKEYTFTVPKYYGMIPTTGNIIVANTTSSVTGVGTLFTQELKKGWYVNMLPNTTFNESTRKVLNIIDDEHMLLDNPFNGNYTGNAYFIVVPPTSPWLASNTAIPLTGTVSTYTTNNAIVGSGTNFTGEVKVGTILQINGDSQAVVSIANSTLLTVGTPWSANNSGVTYSTISPNGVSYLNDNLSQFASFKRFQIKIILQSYSTAMVPLVNDVRALALQL